MTELVYGIHSVKSILDTNPSKILKIYTVYKPWNDRLQSLFFQMKKYNISVQECDRRYLTLKVKGAVHQGIIAKIQQSSCLRENYLLEFLTTYDKIIPLLLILDGLTDPHNLGACLRSADAAGVNMVIAPKNRTVCINSVVRKVSSGATERIPFVQVTNLSRTLQLLKKHDIWIVGTIMQSRKLIFDTKLTGALALVMGSEGDGIRQLIKQNCDELVSIPMIQSDTSLNVSVATGICLFEAIRQRQYKK